MRLIDKDKLLEELIENPKYEDIGNLDDAIEVIKYADEVDLSEIRTQIINEISESTIQTEFTLPSRMYENIETPKRNENGVLILDPDEDLMLTSDEEEEDADGFDPGDDD